MTILGTVYPTDKAKNVWKVPSKGFQLSLQNFGTFLRDAVVGTGSGFISGYDTGGFKPTQQATASTGIFIDSGVYWVRNDELTDKQGLSRIYAPTSGLYYLHPYNASTTGFSFVYLDNQGQLNETTGMTYADVPSNESKVFIASVVRDGNNTITQADILDQRKLRAHSAFNHINIVSDINSAACTILENATTGVLTGVVMVHHDRNPLVVHTQATVQSATGGGIVAAAKLYDGATSLYMESIYIPQGAQSVAYGDYGSVGTIWHGSLAAGEHNIILKIVATLNDVLVDTNYAQLIVTEYRQYG